MAAKTQNAMAPKERVLFIGSNGFVRDSFITLLEREGYDGMVADMADGALRLLKTHDFTMILIDQSSAEMSGLELCRRIYTLYPAKRQILFVDYQSRPTAQEAYEAGIEDWVEKPLSSSAVEKVMFRILKESNRMRTNLNVA